MNSYRDDILWWLYRLLESTSYVHLCPLPVRPAFFPPAVYSFYNFSEVLAMNKEVIYNYMLKGAHKHPSFSNSEKSQRTKWQDWLEWQWSRYGQWLRSKVMAKTVVWADCNPFVAFLFGYSWLQRKYILACPSLSFCVLIQFLLQSFTSHPICLLVYTEGHNPTHSILPAHLLW